MKQNKTKNLEMLIYIYYKSFYERKLVIQKFYEHYLHNFTFLLRNLLFFKFGNEEIKYLLKLISKCN